MSFASTEQPYCLWLQKLSAIKHFAKCLFLLHVLYFFNDFSPFHLNWNGSVYELRESFNGSVATAPGMLARVGTPFLPLNRNHFINGNPLPTAWAVPLKAFTSKTFIWIKCSWNHWKFIPLNVVRIFLLKWHFLVYNGYNMIFLFKRITFFVSCHQWGLKETQ